MPQRIIKTGAVGPYVKELQSVLNKLNCNAGTVDGIFGPRTEEAVKRFQEKHGLEPDGIVGFETSNILDKYLRGYDIHTIETGDTLYNIAREYNTSLGSIFTANPGVNPLKLQPGMEIVVPYGIDVVHTDIDYTYEIMEKNIQGLKGRYPFIETGSAGKSVLGRDLYYIRLGSGQNEVFYNGAHHGNEWITALLLMKFAENFTDAYASGSKIKGYCPGDIWNRSSIYIMPMVNPDGADLVINGISLENPYYKRILDWNKGNADFSHWAANVRGVDINHNYDASWDESKRREPFYGVHGPSYRRYSGPSPESEPETRAVTAFTKKHNFRLVLSYHSQGKVIYWTYNDVQSPESRRIGGIFSKVSGYALSKPGGIASYGGYKDWFIKEYGNPGYTVEVGRGTNPLPVSRFNEIYDDNIEMLLLASLI